MATIEEIGAPVSKRAITLFTKLVVLPEPAPADKNIFSSRPFLDIIASLVSLSFMPLYIT